MTARAGDRAASEVGDRGDHDAERSAAAVLARLAAEGMRGPLRLLKHHTAVEVLEADASTLLSWIGVRRDGPADGGESSRQTAWIPAFLARRRTVEAETVLAAAASSGVWFIPWSDPLYPAGLRELDHPPAGVFGRGDAHMLQATLRAPVVTIVGTRRATHYGRAVTDMLARAFAEAGVTVVSGLAYGIDAQAHRACLAADGQTLAVLGTGAERSYPRRHADLYDRILRRGVVISEVPPGAPVYPWRFPARNRLMAALGDGVLVTEAGARSGALNTAGWAIDLGRPVFAVPGPIVGESSRGTNRLLADGALPCLDVSEAVDDLLAVAARHLRDRGAWVSPSRAVERHRERDRETDPSEEGGERSSQSMILMALGQGALTVDEVVRLTGLSSREVLAGLASLETVRQVVRVGQGRYGVA